MISNARGFRAGACEGSGHAAPASPLELWGGIECTVNRVGDQYFNQMRFSGHDGRIDDLDTIATLGIKRLRYPVLWELTAPTTVANADWSWSDQRLNRLQQ